METFVGSNLVELPCHSNPDARIIGESHEPQNTSPSCLGPRRNPFLHWLGMVRALWGCLAELPRSHNDRHRKYVWHRAVCDRILRCNLHQLRVGMVDLQTSCSKRYNWINHRASLLVWVSVCSVCSHLGVLGI